ncbi:MAG: PaaX family transcriptional regulator C-terminal domain-containing protein [Paracoccus sp. (in: a-proteobacteria)]|nr:PaaX family transcriptional regulator C-terminal domain-containing protein [Paracoccus sp. (in: a-proteobacteria)]
MIQDHSFTPVFDRFRPTATSFIVTIYGDVVVPRGGVLWMGDLIALCAGAGISETLVRTAVSRLVAAGQLSGERRGRRSYYSLAAPARQEFDDAAARLFGPVPGRSDWVILHAPGLADDAARRRGYGAMGAGNFLLPGWMAAGAVPGPEPAQAFRADAISPPLALAARLWELDALAADYREMLALFAPALRAASLAPPGGAEALRLRLALVHSFRRILLRDPQLPPDSLPEGWRGAEARAVFARLYTLLSGAADSFIGARLEGLDGPLPAENEITRARLAGLAAIAGPADD